MPVPRGVLLLADWLAYPSLLAAGVAAAMLVAASRAMGAQPGWITPALAAAGTLVVYNVDRLRDVRADRHSTPLRSAFIERHREVILGVTTIAAGVSIALALRVPGDVQLLCGGVLAVGLLHRRLKDASTWKPIYVTAAWVTVTTGIPATSAEALASVPWVLGVYTATFGSNLLATRLRAGRETAWLWSARGLALTGGLIAAAAPAPVQPLALIPLCELLALVRFRPGERYGLVVIDGALLAGALLALAS
jgi:hypothetical protein